MATKIELRRQLTVDRQAMTTGAVAEKSDRIVAGVQVILQKLPVSGFHCYEPIERLHEVDSTALLKEAAYTSRKIDGEWHIVDAHSGEIVAEPAIDVIIVPMLGFDQRLHRIGYGGGYYDRLLARFPQAIKIGVCYESGRVEHIPAEPHDIPMGIIVTEEAALIAV